MACSQVRTLLMIYSKISSWFILLFLAFALNIVSASDIDSLDLRRDSLLLLVEQTTDEEKKTDLYNAIALSYNNIDDNIQAEKYRKLAYDLALSNKYQFGKAESLYLQARVLYNEKKSEQALQSLDKTLKIIEKISADTSRQSLYLKAKIFSMKGIFLSKNGEYYESNDYYNQAFKIFERLNDSIRYQGLLLNIGYNHEHVGDYDLAIEYYYKSRILFQRLNDYQNLVFSYNNTAYTLTKKEAYGKALSEYTKGLELADKHNIIVSYSEMLYGTGLCLMKLGRGDEALIKFKEAGRMYQDANHELYEAYCNLFIAEIRFSKTKNPTLLSEMENAYRMGEKYQDIELKQFSAKALAEAQASIGKFEKAYEQTNLANRLQDSIKNTELLLKMRAIDSKNRFERAQRSMENEKKEVLLQAKIGHQEQLNRLLFGFVGILTFVGFLLYQAYRTASVMKEKLVVNNNALRKTEERLSESNREMQKYIDLNVELEQFAYIASHDIKGPLRTIQAFSGILKRKFYSQAEKKEKKFFNFIEKGTKSLNLLVDDLLEYSKSNTKTLHIERFGFDEVLQDVIQNLDFSITQVNGTIEATNCNFSINADQIKIKQILQNILSNALKFKDENRNPIVQVSAKEEADYFIISVKDNGIGISEEHFDEVFQKFARLNTQNEYEGTGLGLSICAKYIKKHKGEISISRNEDFGVTFTFSINKHLPLTEEEDSLVEALGNSEE